jgi:hypothetical protein
LLSIKSWKGATGCLRAGPAPLAPSAFVYDAVAKLAAVIEQTDHYGPHNLPGRKYRVYGNPDPEMRSILLSAASHAMN